MSAEPTLPPPRQEEDRIRTRTVLLVLGAGLMLSGAMVLWGWLELRRDIGELRPDGIPRGFVVRVGPREIGGIFQTLIEVDAPGLRLQAGERARLSRYGWVDRAAGRVHIPIERAMQVVLEEEYRGSPAGSHRSPPAGRHR